MEQTETFFANLGVPVNEIKALKWAVIIAVMVMLMQQLSGINAIRFYSSFMLMEAGITSEKETWLGTLGINATTLVVVFIPICFIDKVGRKKMLIISSCIVLIAAVGASLVIMLNETYDNPALSYSSIAFLVLFVIGFNIGLGPIPWLIMVEVSPMRYRGLVVTIATMSNWLSMVVVGQFSETFMEGPIKLFGFSICTMIGILFTVRYIPETNGKTASEIQRALNDI